MSTPHRVSGRTESAAILLAIAAIAVAYILGIRFYGSILTLQKAEMENRALRAEQARLTRQAAQLRALLPGTAAPVPAAPRAATRPNDTAEHLAAVRAILAARDKLKAASITLADQQFRNQQVEASFAAASQEAAQLMATEADLKVRAANAESVLQAMQAEVKGKQDRLVPLELANRSLENDIGAATTRIATMLQPANLLSNLQQRRELYLNNLLSRYSDLTDQYRLQSGGIDNPSVTPAFGAPEMTRIQNLVNQAGQDVRQVLNLDAQARLLIDKMRKFR